MGFLDNLRMSSIFQPGALSGMFPPVQRRMEILPTQEGLTQFDRPDGMYPDINFQPPTPRLNQIAGQVAQPEQQPMNTVFQQDITPYQAASLKLEKERINQTGQLGTERLNIQQQAQQLNELKNQQIYETKLIETERKVTDSENRLKLAYDQLAARQGDAKAQLEFRESQVAAINARHALDIARKDYALEEQKRVNESLIAAREAAIEAGKGSTTKTVLNEEGTERTTTVTRGTNNTTKPAAQTPTNVKAGTQPANTTPMKGGDGIVYYIPNDKVNEAVSKYNMLFVDPKGKVK